MSELGANKALVPKLRFPGFHAEWEPKTLASVCRLKAGDFVRAEAIKERADAKLFPCYGGNGLRGYVETFTHDGTFPLIGRQGALCGNVQLAAGRFHATEHAVAATPRESIDVKWLSYTLTLMNLNKFATGQAQPGLSVEVLNALPLPVPESLAEQRKIAECLESLDELLAAETEKLEALKRHKKGLLQQFFPAEGETTPLLRFPQFRNAADWASTRLGEVCVRIMDGTHFSPKSTQGEFMYVTSKNIQNGYLDLSNVSFISKAEHEAIYKRCPVRRNDVLLTKDGANTGNCAINTLDGPFSLLSSVAVIRGNAELIDQQFIYFSLLTDYMQGRLRGSMSGQAITRITLEKINAFEISIPTLAEQKEIASCLNEASSAESATENVLEGLHAHKAALMQQLFPSLEEEEV